MQQASTNTPRRSRQRLPGPVAGVVWLGRGMQLLVSRYLDGALLLQGSVAEIGRCNDNLFRQVGKISTFAAVVGYQDR